MMIDLWQRVREVFDFEPIGDQQPQIYIDNLSTSVQRGLIQDLLVNIKEINTTFAIPEPYSEVMVKSPDAVVQLLMKGSLVGAIFGQLRVYGYTMPPLGFIFDQPGYMTLAYHGDDDWDALSVIGLFEFFRSIKTVDQDALIHLSPASFDEGARMRFITTLQDYVNEKVDPV